MKIQPSGSQLQRRVSASCTHCGRPAAKEALFKDAAAIIIEKYCDDCIMDPRKFKDRQRLHNLAAHTQNS